MHIVLLIHMHSFLIPAAVNTHSFQTSCKKNPHCTVQCVDLRYRHRKLYVYFFVLFCIYAAGLDSSTSPNSHMTTAITKFWLPIKEL
jgi:hypothetical protein